MPNQTIVRVPTGSQQKLYYTLLADIGANTAAAIADAEEFINASQIELEIDQAEIEIERQIGDGDAETIIGSEMRSIKFRLMNVRKTSAEATEIDTMVTLATGASKQIFLMLLDHPKAVPGAQGPAGMFTLKLVGRGPNSGGEVQYYDFEAKPGVILATHPKSWYQVPT